MNKKKTISIFMIVTVVYLSFIFFFGFENTCLIKNITGIPCPGCGLTRSGLSLVQLNFKDVFYYNPMIFLVIFSVIIVFFRKSGTKKLYASNRFWIILVIAFTFYYVYRMILYFPNDIPMNFDSNALLPRVFKFFNL